MCDCECVAINPNSADTSAHCNDQKRILTNQQSKPGPRGGARAADTSGSGAAAGGTTLGGMAAGEMGGWGAGGVTSDGRAVPLVALASAKPGDHLKLPEFEQVRRCFHFWRRAAQLRSRFQGGCDRACALLLMSRILQPHASH